MGLQGSLLDGFAGTELAPLAHTRRTPLAHGAWVDLHPGWLRGADDLFERLASTVPWQADQRRMYDRIVAIPRLLRFYDETETLPDPILTEARAALTEHYHPELGEPFRTAGLCYYRDSVAWHGDTIGRSAVQDTVVAILTLGTPRPLLLRPRTGGTHLRFRPGHGDLFVMGGSCQRTWEHAVPKSRQVTGPRISIQFRPRNVR